jgi:hypothetical protein
MQLSGAPQGAPFFLEDDESARSEDRDRDNHEPGRDTGGSREHPPAVAPRSVNTGCTARSDHGCVEFGRIRKRARQCGACPFGIALK